MMKIVRNVCVIIFVGTPIVSCKAANQTSEKSRDSNLPNPKKEEPTANSSSINTGSNACSGRFTGTSNDGNRAGYKIDYSISGLARLGSLKDCIVVALFDENDPVFPENSNWMSINYTFQNGQVMVSFHGVPILNQVYTFNQTSTTSSTASVDVTVYDNKDSISSGQMTKDLALVFTAYPSKSKVGDIQFTVRGTVQYYTAALDPVKTEPVSLSIKGYRAN